MIQEGPTERGYREGYDDATREQQVIIDRLNEELYRVTSALQIAKRHLLRYSDDKQSIAYIYNALRETP